MVRLSNDYRATIVRLWFDYGATMPHTYAHTRPRAPVTNIVLHEDCRHTGARIDAIPRGLISCNNHAQTSKHDKKTARAAVWYSLVCFGVSKSLPHDTNVINSKFTTRLFLPYNAIMLYTGISSKNATYLQPAEYRQNGGQNMATTNATLARQCQELRELIDATAQANARIDELKASIKAECIERGTGFSFAGVKAVYKAGYTSPVARSYKDIALVLADYPELLANCTKMRETSASVAISA